MSKYDPLHEYLSHRTEGKVQLSLAEIESIIGDELPKSAYKHEPWWSNSTTKDHPHSKAWTDCGFKTVNVAESLKSELITFVK